jgi:hypothetical protein
MTIAPRTANHSPNERPWQELTLEQKIEQLKTMLDGLQGTQGRGAPHTADLLRQVTALERRLRTLEEVTETKQP